MEMVTLVWVNTLFLVGAAIIHGIIIYAVVREGRKISETLSRVERISLATLQRLAAEQ